MKSDGDVKWKRPDLKTAAWLIFPLVFALSVAIAAAIIFGPDDLKFQERISTAVAGADRGIENISGSREELAAVFARIKIRALFAVVLCFAGTAAIYWMLFRAFFRRLDRLADCTGKIAEGKLDETAPVYSGDEFERLGSSINDFAANLQEVLLSLWNHTQRCLCALERTGAKAADHADGGVSEQKTACLLRKDLEDMRDMIRIFEFYDVHLDGGKTVMSEDAGENGDEESP